MEKLKVKIKKEEVATQLAKILVERIKDYEGLQHFLRNEFHVHGSYFSLQNADKLSKAHYAEIVGGIILKESRRDFLLFWSEYGKRLWDIINENEDDFYSITEAKE